MKFSSSLSGHLENFLLLKQALGNPYGSNKNILASFDQYCQDHCPGAKTINREMAMTWIGKKQEEHINTQIRRTTPIRQFAKYLNSIGIEAYVLPSYYPSKGVHYEPHIFTAQELALFFSVADDMPPSPYNRVRHLFASVFFRLVYSCGLREGEALRLKISEVDIESGALFIYNSKGPKDRRVVMAEPLVRLCKNYLRELRDIFPDSTWFFPGVKGLGHISSSSVILLFHEIWNKTGITRYQGNPPRIHDFRHTMAVNTLARWVRERKDYNVLLPYLCRYLGHKSMRETDYYLHFTPEFFPTFKTMAGDTSFIPEAKPYDAR